MELILHVIFLHKLFFSYLHIFVAVTAAAQDNAEENDVCYSYDDLEHNSVV
jgi:hypothetical protein